MMLSPKLACKGQKRQLLLTGKIWVDQGRSEGYPFGGGVQDSILPTKGRG